MATEVDGVPFIGAFYKRFLSKSVELSILFANTNMHKQKRMLALSLLYVGAFDPIQGPNDVMIVLSRQHRALGLTPKLYGLWLESLLDTVKAYDPECDEDVCESWRRHLGPGIEYMIAEGSK